jgi:ABC-type protease/lipase transport system fused ATPase/permease subunit
MKPKSAMTPKPGTSELREAVASLRPFFVRSLWFSLVCSVLVLAPSAYMLEVYERVVNSRSHMTLWMLTLVVLGAFVVMELLEWARSEVMRSASIALDRKLSSRVFNAIFEANLKKLPGGTQQPMNDFRQVRDFLFSPVLLALMEAPVSLLMMVLLFLISPVLGWTALVFGLVTTVVGWFNERSTKPPLMQANRAAIEAQQYADNALRNAEVVESMGMLRNTQKRWLERQREFLGLQAQASSSAGGYQAVSKLLQTTLASALLGLACWLLLHNQLNGGAGMMIVASILGGRMLAPLVQTVSQWQSVVNVRDAWTRLDSLLTAVPQRPESMALPAPRGALQVEQLIAGAPGNPAPILRGVQFALAPGHQRQARRHWRACWWACGPRKAARCGWMAPTCTPGTRGSWAFTWATCPKGWSCLRARWLRTSRALPRWSSTRWKQRRGRWAFTTSFCRCRRATRARWGLRARGSRAGSASGWPWRGRCMATRYWWCSTSPIPVWTRKAMRRWPGRSRRPKPGGRHLW